MAKTTIVADFSTTITAKWAIGATTGTLTSATDDDGVALPTGRYGFTIDRNNSAKEYITCTLTGTSLTDIKTVSRQGVETAGTIREHRKGAEIVITDFVAINEFINSSGDTTFTGDVTFSGSLNVPSKLKIPFFASAAARDAAITSPSDSMMCYVNDVEEFYGYKNGAWQTLGSGGGGSAVWYQDSTGDGTITGAINGVNTTYTLSHTPGSVDAFVLTYNGQVLERGAGDDYTLTAKTITMNFAPVSGKLVAIYPDVGVGTQNATTRATTGASAVNGELYRKTDDSYSLYYKDNAGDEVKLIDITKNQMPGANIDIVGTTTKATLDTGDFFLITDDATGLNKKIVTSTIVTGIKASDAEVIAGTEAGKFVTPSGLPLIFQKVSKTVASNTLQYSDDTEASLGASSSYLLAKSVSSGKPGTYRVKIDLKSSNATNYNYQIRTSRSSVETTLFTGSTTGGASYVTYSNDITLTNQDHDILIYLQGNGALTPSYKNFRIYNDFTLVNNLV